MLLAGGQGSRLFALTQKKAKPAVSYGGKYKIIDFPLSNCTNSGIDTVGVLTQYEPLELNAYIGTGGFPPPSRYSFRHSLFLTLHHSFRYGFDALRMLLYRCINTSLSFGVVFQPRTFSAQDLSTSELLRTL